MKAKPKGNSGKICVSICAKTADELYAQLGLAETSADMVEARFDCLEPEEIMAAMAGVRSTKPLLFTYRPESQGGSAPDDPSQRIMFWISLFGESEMDTDLMWFDNEIEFGSGIEWSDPSRIIRSFHHFDTDPIAIERLYDDLAKLGGVAKIAVAVADAVDALRLWNVLKKAVSDGHPIIPIAMGEGGKWTRILGLAHGAFLTYASPDDGGATAPGQFSARDLDETFRVKDLNRDTEIFGILAGDTSYSISPWMHNSGFAALEMNKVFVPFQASDIAEFFRRMVLPETRETELNFGGFSVTNPHKQTIMPILDHIDETAAMIGAVNTVRVENGELCGYNTDAPGFIAPLKIKFGDLKDSRVAVAGAGGAARACVHALKSEGADVTLFARDEKKAGSFANDFHVATAVFSGSKERDIFTDFDILVNATPLGTKGDNENETVAVADQLTGLKLVYDLIYNPLETKLIREARSAGVNVIGGLDMLVAQGAKQFEIWTGKSAPVETMTDAVKKKLGL